MSVHPITTNLQSAIQNYMLTTTDPVTCADMMRDETILQLSLERFGGVDGNTQTATNKLSDMLGYLWRRGLLTRYRASGNSASQARFAYQWARQGGLTQSIAPVIPRKGKPTINLSESENGDVHIETEHFQITVRYKEKK